MKWTRLSLFYLAGYTGLMGIAFLFAPDFTMKLLRAQRTYEEVFIRFTGALMTAFSVIVSQVIRLRIEALYSTTLVIRVFFIACILWFRQLTGDSVFFAFLAVVALGFVFTTTAFITDRRAAKSR